MSFRKMSLGADFMQSSFLFALLCGSCLLYQPTSFTQIAPASKQAQLKQLDQLHQLHMEEEKALNYSVTLQLQSNLAQTSYIADHIREERVHVTSLQVGNSALRLQESGATKKE